MTKDLFRLRKFCEDNHYQDILKELELFNQATGIWKLVKLDSLYALINQTPEVHRLYLHDRITALGLGKIQTPPLPNNGKAV